MDGVSRCEAQLWIALAADPGRWRKLREAACAAGIADQTAYQILIGWCYQGLAVRVRLGLPWYYQLGPDSPARRAYMLRVRATAEVLGLGGGRKQKAG